jgi:hypothetical protein
MHAFNSSTTIVEALNARFIVPIADQKETRSFYFPLPLSLISRQTNGFYFQWLLSWFSGKVVIGMERMRENGYF